jgi:Ca2+/H+ antiporter, TMEM165/GDT1 family
VNAFIPALIAVLLAETGGRSAVFARLPRLTLAATALGLAVGVAAVAGYAMAPTMTPRARALMLGLALVLSGAGQFGRYASVEAPWSFVQTLLLVSRTGVPLLAFALAIWSGTTMGPVAGALAGFVGAVAIGAILGEAMPVAAFQWLRRCAGALLLVTGIYCALWALRVI